MRGHKLSDRTQPSLVVRHLVAMPRSKCVVCGRWGKDRCLCIKTPGRAKAQQKTTKKVASTESNVAGTAASGSSDAHQLELKIQEVRLATILAENQQHTLKQEARDAKRKRDEERAKAALTSTWRWRHNSYGKTSWNTWGASSWNRPSHDKEADRRKGSGIGSTQGKDEPKRDEDRTCPDGLVIGEAELSMLNFGAN